MHILNCKGKLLLLDKPVVMGIINVTPDSFYAGSRKNNTEECLEQASKMLQEGAAIVDIGGQSTRPGSVQISASEEAERILPVIEVLSKNLPGIIISADTFYAAVAAKAVEAGASIINDVSGGMFDGSMLETVGKLNVPFICMHSKGLHHKMPAKAFYGDVVKEVLDFFIERLDACRQHNITDIIFDPGFGFSKTPEHNFTLLKNLSILKMPGKPLLAGISRKSTIYGTLGITAQESLNGSTVLHTISLLNGASVLRVHDVKEAVQAIKLVEAYSNTI